MVFQSAGQGVAQRPSPRARSLRQATLKIGNTPLRPEGYLFKKPVPETFHQAHLLGTTVQARRDGFLKDFIAPDHYVDHCNRMIEKTRQKTDLHQQDFDMTPAGDEIDLHEDWPSIKKTNRIRVIHANVHGLHPGKNNLECDYLLQQLAGFQTDIAQIVEVNQPLNNYRFQTNLRNAIKHFDKHARINFGCWDTPTTETGIQMGGLMTVTQGGAAGLINSSGRDPIGRWTWNLLGKPDLCLISAYRVGPGNDGIRTIRAMEMRRLMQTQHRLAKNPRKAFDHDIKLFIQEQKEKGRPVLLLLDANSGHTETDIKSLQRATGLVNIFTRLHQTATPPRTYDRGRQCIDLALGCDESLQYVESIGYLPFYAITPDDHRALFLDLSANLLRSGLCEDGTFTKVTTPSIRKPSQVQAFLVEYKRLLKKAGVLRKVKKIKERFPNASPRERHQLIARLDKYDAVWVELALSATRKNFRRPGGTFPWSPTLARDGAIARYWKQRLLKCRLDGSSDHPEIHLPNKYHPAVAVTEEQILAQYLDAIRKWHVTKGNAAQLRHQHLEDLIHQTMEERDIKRETAIKLILHWEEIRNLHQRHTGIMKRSKPSVIQSLIIPQPHSTNPEAMMEITDPTHIQQIILQRNAQKLAAAQHSPFNQQPLLTAIGTHGDTDIADQILNGTFDFESLPWEHLPHHRELRAFLRNMKRPLDDNGQPIPDMTWSYGADEFRDTFSKKREDTACGPSGITMQFYRMFCTDDDLSEFHATIIELPFKYGFSLTRWKQSVHFMLMKTDAPLWEKLRIIQLLEGDFNGGLRYIFGRKLMSYGDTKKISSDSTYGGRGGRSCHDALLRIQLSMEYYRVMRIIAAFLDVDANGCFDRQLRNLIAALTRRQGIDKNASKCQTSTLEEMEHSVRIKQGLSTEIIRHSTEKPIFGSGQGSGAGVVNWHAHNETIIATYKEFFPGATMKSPDSSKIAVQDVISFVDDNKLVHDFPPSTTNEQALAHCEHSLTTWQTIMTLTGGSLELAKCKIQLLAFNFNTYTSHPSFRPKGEPTLLPPDQVQGQCAVQHETTGEHVLIEQIHPSVGRKLLGVQLAADGNCRDEFQTRKLKSEILAGRLENSTATPVDAYMIMAFRYCPSIFYCLPVTHFTAAQCNKIQGPFMHALLPKLRMNRHMKRATIWGPMKYGGLAFKHMHTEQLISNVRHLIGHVRKQSPTGTAFCILCDALQLYLGVAQPFFRLDPATIPYRPSSTHSKISFVWESLHAINCRMDLAQQWKPSPMSLPCIMDLLLSAYERNKGTAAFIQPQHLRYANNCRLWLRACYLTDITLEDGSLNMDMYYGTTKCNTDLTYPEADRPPSWVWIIWQELLRKACLQWRNSTFYAFVPLSFTASTPDDMPCIQLPQTLRPYGLLKDVIDDLPPAYRQILGDIDLPDDDGFSLAHALQDGTLMSYSDGTVLDECGAHAYTLRCLSDIANLSITGGAPSCGDPQTISSLRTEHYGFLAIATCVWILCKRYNVTDGHFTSAVDNSAVVTRITSGLDGLETASRYLTTDYDLWKETLDLLDSLPVTVNLRHVKGHQDEMYSQGIQGPLTRDAFWNVQMDALAASKRLTTPTPIQECFQSTGITFFNGNDVVTTDIGPCLKDKILAPALVDYICNKEEWTQETFDLVDWDALERCLGKMSIHKRINAAKYMFNWQNTGRQKQHFEDSLARNEDRPPKNAGLCPMGCGQYECSQHFLVCPILQDAQIISRDLDAVRKWMVSKNTQDELKIVLMTGFTHWLQEGTSKADWTLSNSDYRDDLETAILHQNMIGWDNAFKGRLAVEWGCVQMRYYKTRYTDKIPAHLSATWWTSELSRQLLFFSLAIWQHRNTYLHDTLAQRRLIDDRRQAVEEMATWYERQNTFPLPDRHNFARTFLDRCSDTTKQIRLWLGKIDDIYEYNKQATIRRFLTPVE